MNVSKNSQRMLATFQMHTIKAVRALIAIALFWGCFLLHYAQYYAPQSLLSMTLLMVFVYAGAQVMLGKIYHAYNAGTASVLEMIYSLSLADLIGAGVLYVVICLTLQTFVPPYPLVELLAAQLILNLVWAFVADRLYYRLHAPSPTVVIYRDDDDLQRLRELRQFSRKFDVRKYIQDPSDIQTVLEQVQGYEVIFTAGIDIVLRNEITKYCLENDVEGYFKPKVADIIMAGAEHMKMFSIPFIRVRRAVPSFEFMFLKRSFDILASLLAMIILSPIFLLTTLAIRLYDGGPAFYKQTRLTQDGRAFEILKFRSMRVDAEKDGVARMASEQDDRITPIGKVIRACRLDELPQLINILVGEMSIVGPRPERPEIAEQYEAAMPTFRLRLQVKAGLTGYAQIYGRYNTEPYDKLQMDLMYVNNMSASEDLRLMFATVKILFMKGSTEGVASGKTIALEKKRSVVKERV